MNIPPADIAAILAAIATIRAKLPGLLSLGEGEKQEMAAIGDKTVGFHEKCQSYMASNPELLPGFVDMAEVTKDQTSRDQFLQFNPPLQALAKEVGDTFHVINHELYVADLAYMNTSHEAAHRGAKDAQTIYNELSVRFPGRTSAKKAKTP